MYLYYLCFKNVHRSCSKISSPSIIWSCQLFWYYAISLQKICAWFLSWIWYIHLLIVVGYVSGQWHRPGYRLTLSLGSRCPLESTAFRQVDLYLHKFLWRISCFSVHSRTLWCLWSVKETCMCSVCVHRRFILLRLRVFVEMQKQLVKYLKLIIFFSCIQHF